LPARWTKLRSICAAIARSGAQSHFFGRFSFEILLSIKAFGRENLYLIVVRVWARPKGAGVADGNSNGAAGADSSAISPEPHGDRSRDPGSLCPLNFFYTTGKRSFIWVPPTKF
jgi:hypothetical protein